MQRESPNSEPKSADEEITKNKFLSVNPINELVRASPKPSTWRPVAKTSLLNVHSEIKRRDVVSAVPLKGCNDLIEIRSTKQRSKSDINGDPHARIITINVSGDRFQTQSSTLELYPDTLLGDENKRKFYWNPVTQEYFFDRHRASFDAILYYYQSHGRLRRPDVVPLDTFMEEVAFFQLGKEAIKEVHVAENVKEVQRIRMPRILWRRYIWYYMEYPQHSVFARVINLISMFFTILSCIALAVESLPKYTNRWDDICLLQANLSLNATFVPRCPALFTSPFFIIQTICVAYFTIEFVLRLISTPSYFRFFISFYNWVDLSAIIPYYVFLGIQVANQDIGVDTNTILCIRLLRILRFSRIFKIYLVFQRLKSLRVLSATVKESLVDFAVMVTILTLLAFLFGAATYFAEQTANGDMFDSIPKATYWGIITITGVGYGDMYPVTAAGRVLTCLCALFGSATMGMLVSVLVDRYQRVYNRKMYVSEPEPIPVDFDDIDDDDDQEEEDAKSAFSSQKSSRRRDIQAAITQRFSAMQDKIKNERHQSYKVQFVISFNDNNRDHSATEPIVNIMKEKLTEAISTADIDVNLQLIDNDSKEIWTISSSDILTNTLSELTLSTDIDDQQQTKIEMF